MVYADLHVHTDNSDGTLALADVPDAACDAGLHAIAITDHDRLHPELHQPITVCKDTSANGETPDGIELIHSIELRVDTGDQRIDLLGYGVTATAPLKAECERIQRDRVERGAKIIDNVETQLGVELGVEPREGLGRPHIAHSVVENPNTEFDDISSVFEALIGNNKPSFVARDVPDFETGVELLREACELVGLAHPLRYTDPETALACCAKLDAVELHYPYDRPVGRNPTPDGRELVESTIERHDLLVTGGSDAHGTIVGNTGLSREEYGIIRDNIY